ncbi:MAG: anti-sigma factor [Chloroflexota bacterium]
MDHLETLEALEIAAVEPGGLDRLMAGDTAWAAAIAGHLAGCDACAGEMERLRRAAPVLREVVRTTPPADLRTRTLSLVRERGLPRGPAAAPSGPSQPVVVSSSAPLPRPRRLMWIAGIAAAVVVSVVASTLIVGARFDDRLAAQERTIAGLEAVTSATLAISADPDRRTASLAATDGSEAQGSVLYSPVSGAIVVVATGVERPPAGSEFRCWVMVDGARQPVGRMYFADDLAYWVGEVPMIAGLPRGTTFGMSLAPVGGEPGDEPLLVGEL